MIVLNTITGVVLALCILLGAYAIATSLNPSLNLSVVEIVERHPPYADFCRRHRSECELGGRQSLTYSADIMRLVSATNSAVNHEVRFMLDSQQYNVEEYWALPDTGWGDCEDKALEKRARLTKQGLPRGAMRLAIGFHKQLLISHCVLMLETSNGTFTLDSLSDEVIPWYESPYNYEMRERPDGRWDRFDQTLWTLD